MTHLKSFRLVRTNVSRWFLLTFKKSIWTSWVLVVPKTHVWGDGLIHFWTSLRSRRRQKSLQPADEVDRHPGGDSSHLIPVIPSGCRPKRRVKWFLSVTSTKSHCNDNMHRQGQFKHLNICTDYIADWWKLKPWQQKFCSFWTCHWRTLDI